jgi:hypothetical protein
MSTPTRYLIVLLYEKDEYVVRRDESGPLDNYWLAHGKARIRTEDRRRNRPLRK